MIDIVPDTASGENPVFCLPSALTSIRTDCQLEPICTVTDDEKAEIPSVDNSGLAVIARERSSKLTRMRKRFSGLLGLLKGKKTGGSFNSFFELSSHHYCSRLAPLRSLSLTTLSHYIETSPPRDQPHAERIDNSLMAEKVLLDPAEWKAYGAWARPIINGVIVHNASKCAQVDLRS